MAALSGDSTNNNLNGTPSEINFIYGLSGDDHIVGGYLTDFLYGGNDNDLISGQYGDDFIDGGTGNDTIDSGAGDDTILDGSGNNYIDAGAGDDQVSVNDVGLGKDGINKILLGQGDDIAYLGGQYDVVDGGLGIDEVSYLYSPSAVTVNLQSGKGMGGWADYDIYASIEAIEGSKYNDTLIGNGAYNTIFGGYGDDTISGGVGGDELDGGDGSDTLDYSKSSAAVQVNLLTGEASGGDAAGDSFFNFENIAGSAFIDTLIGDAGENSLKGNAGADRLFGGSGNDHIAGGDGADLILGQAGADIMAGGTGADRFIYSSISESGVPSTTRDWIRDFSVSDGDRIDLSRIDANTAAAGNQAFTFIGSSNFSGVSGQLRSVVAGSNTLIYGDVDGDKVADFSILVSGTPAFTSAQFIL